MWDAIQEEERGTVIANDRELDALAAKFKVTLPADYRAFLKKFGEGVVYNHFRIFGPEKITDEAATFQERWGEYFLWDGEGSALGDEELVECMIIGDTFNGDELVLSPAHPGSIFYLPQDSDDIVDLGPSLEAALTRLVARLEAALVDDPDRDEWDLRPVFSREDF